jgi:hypothetical protein
VSSAKISAREFLVEPGADVDLKKCPTLVDPVYDSKKDYHKLLRRQVKALSLLQRLHYASNPGARRTLSRLEGSARIAALRKERKTAVEQTVDAADALSARGASAGYPVPD